MNKPEIGIYIDRTYKVVRQDMINRFKAHGIDLTPEQWILLAKLDEHGTLSQTELAAMSFKDKPTVSRIIDLLVKKGIVNRRADEQDRRRFHIDLTSEGHRVIGQARPQVVASRAQGWQNITEEEYHQLVAILDKIFMGYSQ